MMKPDEISMDNQVVKPFLEHLEDLRVTFIKCAVSLAVGILVCLPLTPWILSMLKRPLGIVTDNPDQFLRSLEVGGAFLITMRISFWSGLLLSAPFIVLFIGQFIFPGLTAKEKRLVRGVGGIAVILFILGVFMGYLLTLPAALRWMFRMHGWLGISAEWTVTSYVAFALQLLIGFGIAFEVPAVLLGLVKLGLLSYAQLKTARPYAVVAALVLGMLLTPPDVFSQLLMAIPLMALYEICVWISWADEKRKRIRSAGH